MNNILLLIEQNGGFDKLKKRSLKIKNEGFMDLVIEYIGKGPRGKDAISVSHFYIQNGDLMYDPEVCFELSEEFALTDIKGISRVQMEMQLVPFLFRQDSWPPRYDEVYLLDEDDSILETNQKLLKSIQSFCVLWNRNLKDQGFLDPKNTSIEEIQ
ncbi:hypothetical protein CH379_018430 [Leptospira ellisii]|uniref:DUF6908 domain-containing protein n=1 Tax=Leptospira ellisii TaxID=2023197 RepID=A0A2N0B557_9LEPT|nr:hypothetical protein [Leptospira ellisii]MDV6237614.1 hypothetical protein [Leptospira ellisii]PJZ91687.1 hypothetical protein CH379_17270 [Leptospira ellisii]PKA02906.1 hypothetical protein CH375_20165 [Leptospira ellisii]